jgi:hypothetical protein
MGNTIDKFFVGIAEHVLKDSSQYSFYLYHAEDQYPIMASEITSLAPIIAGRYGSGFEKRLSYRKLKESEINFPQLSFWEMKYHSPSVKEKSDLRKAVNVALKMQLLDV